jgi:transcriptional antiterminator NusG
MSDPIDKPSEATSEAAEPRTGGVENHAPSHVESADPEVNEEMPDGGDAHSSAASRKRKLPPKLVVEAATETTSEPEPQEADVRQAAAGGHSAEIPTQGADDDEPQPELVWYVLKVQSSREDTIRDALQRRVKIQGLQKYFDKIVVPTEKITEIRNNKKRVVERKTYPGYIMVQMELNEKTWFLVRETPGVGDFVGAHGTPTRMTETEVNQMLHQEEEKTTAEAPKVRIDVERGDRVKIKDGPFENFEGTVEEVIEGRGLVKVMLIIFNRPTPVDLEYWQLERI